MAPEQADPASSSTVDQRADVYSAAVILYELLTGNVPFPYDSISEIVQAQRKGTYPRLSSVRPEIPSELDAVVEKGLHPDLAKRHASISEWLGELERLSTALGPEHDQATQTNAAIASPTMTWLDDKSETTEDTGTWRRKVLASGVGAIVLLALLVGGVGFLVSEDGDSTSENGEASTLAGETIAEPEETPTPNQVVDVTPIEEPTVTPEPTATQVPEPTPTEAATPIAEESTPTAVVEHMPLSDLDLASALITLDDLPSQWIQVEPEVDSADRSEPPCAIRDTFPTETVEVFFEKERGSLSAVVEHSIRQYAENDAETRMEELRETIHACSYGWEEQTEEGYDLRWGYHRGNLPILNSETVAVNVDLQADISSSSIFEGFINYFGHIHVSRRDNLISTVSVWKPQPFSLTLEDLDYVGLATVADRRIAELAGSVSPDFEVGDTYTFTQGNTVTLHGIRPLTDQSQAYALDLEACADMNIIPRPSSESVGVVLSTGEYRMVEEGDQYGLDSPPRSDAPSDIVLWQSCSRGENVIILEPEEFPVAVVFEDTPADIGFGIPIAVRWVVSLDDFNE